MTHAPTTSSSPRWRDIPTTVETTAPDTHAREAGRLRRKVGFRSSRAIDIDGDETWMFTDGSGTGWHGAVVLRPGSAPRLIARERVMPMKNVAAEMNGLLLALDAARPGESITVVSDYLWDIYYVLGWYDVKVPALVELTREARAKLEARRPSRLRYIHTRGHRNDGSDFGLWNTVADRLCAAKVAVDREFPEATIRSHLAKGLPLATLLLST